MRKHMASFEIDCTAYLNADGAPLGDLPDFAGDTETVVALYRAMVRTRAFDTKAIALQRTGRLGTYASCLGQEAIGVGAASAMEPGDVLLPSFREHAAQLRRGVTPVESLLYWGGDERGSDFAGPRNDFPVCIPVASQFPHAAGVALAMSLNREKAVAVAIGGDGSTSKGEFYEALNLVGLWTLPAVFVINNNQWAISVRRREQSAAKTLAQKAIAAGMPGEQADGNDVIAVRDAVSRALARAREGAGGTLIECLSYRLGDHTTADDARRYREDEEVKAHWKEEPIARLRAWLVAEHGWSKTDEESLLRGAADEMDAAAEAYLATEPEQAASMFDHLYETLPGDLTTQRAEVSDG
ncbi:MAG: pyruvate dehydrogenase (acetyl-transferring) E1 component subunit alpha [Paracoccaceae bacterium]|nr:pyruvate dehydrogenase (acetyl-transferring) E1 component subunit alpha [Paracoccaceae bacterium]